MHIIKYKQQKTDKSILVYSSNWGYMMDYIQSRLSIKSCLEKILKSMHKI